MNPRFPALVVALTLLLAGCGGGDGDGGSSKGDDDASTSTTEGGAAAGTTDASGDGGTAAGGGKGSTAASGGTKAGSTSTGAKSGAASASGVGASAGSYTYTRKGESSVSGGYTASKKIDTSYTATFEASKGTDQRVTYVGSYSDKEDIFRFGASGVELVFAKVSYSTHTKDFRPEPPVPFAPKPATVGRTWSYTMTSTDGTTTITGNGKVLRTERITVAGESLDTVVYEVALDHKHPEFSRTEKHTIWWSDKHSLLVKSFDEVEGEHSGFHVKSHATTTINSLKPSR